MYARGHVSFVSDRAIDAARRPTRDLAMRHAALVETVAQRVVRYMTLWTLLWTLPYGCPRDTPYGPPMDALWTPYGPPVDPLWTPCGPPIRAEWASAAGDLALLQTIFSRELNLGTSYCGDTRLE